MNSPGSPWIGRLLLAVSLAGTALLSAIRVAAYDSSPWFWVAVFAIGTAILVGPVAWVLRDRLPEERRRNLAYVAGGIALLFAPIVLGLGLVFGSLLLFLDAGVLGGIVGLAVASLVERIVVPERLRGTGS